MISLSFLFILIFLGLVVGFIGGYAGIGGAPLMLAFLVLVLGIPQLSAQGIVLTMMLGPMSLLGLLALKEELKKQKKSIFFGVLAYAFFSYFGAVLAFRFGEFHLRQAFAFFLVLVALLEFLPDHFFTKGKAVENIAPVWIFVIGAITGIVGGLFGIGAGVLMIPIFMIFFRLKKNYARALSLAILLPPVSIGAFLKYAQEGVIYWKEAIVLFFAYFFANYFGAKLGGKARVSFFKKVYASILLVIALFYFLS